MVIKGAAFLKFKRKTTVKVGSFRVGQAVTYTINFLGCFKSMVYGTAEKFTAIYSSRMPTGQQKNP